MNNESIITAPELYAMTQSKKCEGNEICHWCGAKCSRQWMHDEPPPVPFRKNTLLAKHPNRLYICKGCWLFRRGSITIHFINGEFKDRQQPKNHSWWITEEAKAIRKEDRSLLYPILTKPPLRFVLSLIDETFTNQMQLASVNDAKVIKGDTNLHFTLNNIPHTYNVYELQKAMQANDPAGCSPGVHALLRYLGQPPVELQAEEKGRGRPTNESQMTPKKEITTQEPVKATSKR